MTDHSELIARLRDWRGDPDEVMEEAATALEAQAAEIERLTTQAEIQDQHDSQEIAALRAQLAAAQGQSEIDLTPRTPEKQAEALRWIESLRTQQAQPEPFTPDWSQDSAAAESIREHQAICNLLLKEMRHIAGISTGQVKRVAEQALEAAKQAQPEPLITVESSLRFRLKCEQEKSADLYRLNRKELG